ncbi:ferric reduction oxidase 2-like [Dorcoceras hygrometricum]|uniref:Ferric reduction oxidase 2-like n=1 Tax=Dorcoceras hygrometricum TaxID=472368 RepID=A0A2Z7CBA4_9LAMI|nr:ferric reduction oxidase 2-like [Dorcoceras hygrometricum]
MPPRRDRSRQDDSTPPPPPPPQLTRYERASMDMLAGITRLLEHQSERPGKSHEEDFAESPSQLGGRHSNPVVTTPMIALDFSGTTHQSASHNVAPNQITQSTAELTADATSFHLVQKFTTAGFLELKSVQGTNNKSKVQNNEECSPKSLNPQEKRTTQISQKASNASNSTLPDSTLIQGLKWVAIERGKLGEFNATKIIKNRGWKRRESAMESYGEQ